MIKKIVIILLIVFSIAFFAQLIRYGFQHARGIPVVDKEQAKPILEVHSLNKEIDLSVGIDRYFWQSIKPQKLKLLYQLMALPWPKKSVPFVEVKAFHNNKDIYFYLEWPDDTIDKTLKLKQFSDASAVLFPLGDDPQSSTLMMGFLGQANIWHWKANQDVEYWLKEQDYEKVYVDFYYPFEEEELFVVSKSKLTSAVSDLMAVRVGTITQKPEQDVTGRGIHEQGKWKVVFKRALAAKDADIDAQFNSQEKLCAFAVWNGSHGDRGGRKSISDWVTLKIEQ